MDFISNLYNSIYYYLTGAQFGQLVLALQIVSWAISIFLIFLILFLLKRSDTSWVWRERQYARRIARGPQYAEQKWQKILERLEKGDEANLKLAVIEADSVLADTLKYIIPSAENTAERLEKIDRNRLPSLGRVWEAHRLRNFIVHNHKVPITRQQAQEAIDGFEQGLKELEYL